MTPARSSAFSILVPVATRHDVLVSVRAALTLLCTLLGACAHGGDPQGIASAAFPSAQPIVIAPVAPATSGAREWDPQARQPVPLRAGDVQLYLTVMRAAAERARHPTKKDLDAIQATETWSAVVDSASRTQARPPAPLDEAMIERSSNLTGQMADVQVASERGIDLARYQEIRDTIESIATPPRVEDGACVWDGCAGASAATPNARGYREVLATTLARDRRLLAPRLAEIRSLQAIVRARR